MAEILYTDGTSKEVHPANGDHFDTAAGRAGLPPNEQATALAGFPSNEGPLGTLRGLGVESPAYAVGPLGMAYIPGTVLVSTKQEVSWTD